MTAPKVNHHTVTDDTTVPIQRKAAVAIDHRFFPHIVDLIFASLLYPGLVICSQACREWRERARSMHNHIAIFEKGNEGIGTPTVIRSRSIDWPGMSAVLVDSLFPSTRGTLSSIEDDGNAIEFTAVDSYYNTFGPAQVRGPPSQWPTVFHRLLDPSYDRDDDSNYRYCLDGAFDYLSCFFRWDDVVHFIDYSDQWLSMPGDCPSDPINLVLSIDCYRNPKLALDWPSAFYEVGEFEYQSSLTVIFNNCVTRKPGIVGSARPSPTISGWLSTWKWKRRKSRSSGVSNLDAACELLLFAMAEGSPHTTVTVVGLEAFSSGVGHVSYLQELCPTIAYRLKRNLVPSVENGVPCLAGHLVFFTHQQYREMVGEECYRLLTVR